VQGILSIAQVDATNFVLNVVLASDDIGLIEVQIEDTIGNPAQPEVLALDTPVNEWKRWVSKGDAGTGSFADGGSGTVGVVLLGEGDMELDVSVEGTDTLGTRLYLKKRPGAPKGRLRSPKVRAMVEVL